MVPLVAYLLILAVSEKFKLILLSLLLVKEKSGSDMGISSHTVTLY